MSDTPDKKDTPSSEPADSTEKKSPWFVTPMGGEKQEDKQQEDQPDKIKLQPEESKETKGATAETPEKSGPAAPTSKPGVKPPATKPEAKPPAPKPEAKPAASKPAPKAPASKPNPLAGGSSITVDEEDESDSVSMPMLVVDGVAAAVAIAFTVLILQDVLPFL